MFIEKLILQKHREEIRNRALELEAKLPVGSWIDVEKTINAFYESEVSDYVVSYPIQISGGLVLFILSFFTKSQLAWSVAMFFSLFFIIIGAYSFIKPPPRTTIIRLYTKEE